MGHESWTSTARALVAIAVMIVAAAESSAADVTVLRCGLLIEPGKPEPRRNIQVLVRGDRIERVGPQIEIPADATSIDLEDETCLPGLIDLHTHLMITMDRTVTQNFLERSSAEKALLAIENARTMLELGFTTILSAFPTESEAVQNF